jgi:hypothetical protein
MPSGDKAVQPFIPGLVSASSEEAVAIRHLVGQKLWRKCIQKALWQIAEDHPVLFLRLVAVGSALPEIARVLEDH